MGNKKRLSIVFLTKRFFLKSEQFLFLLGLVLSIIGALSALILPFIVGSLTDNDKMNYILSHKGILFIGVVIVFIIYIIQGLSAFLLGKVGAGVIKNMENEFVNHSLSLPIDQLNKFSAGDLASRLTNDISATARVITTTIP
ncbi:ABC transporter ATP-binding protein [Streptococcus sp. sy010]|nr:ABC transporter ATP-binding protein [Streptococcus sp. sy010]